MAGRTSQSINIRTLARHTGLSIGTVSSVLTNQHEKRRIALATVYRVRDAARDLGYVPNMVARRLRNNLSQERQVILAIVTSYEAPVSLTSYAIHSLRKIIDEGSMPSVSFTMTIEMFRAGRLRMLPGILSTDRFNGAILTNTTAQDDEFLNSSFIPFPIVVLNRDIFGYNTVSEHPEAGGRAAQTLLNLDRRNLAILHPTILTMSTMNRVESFKRTVTKITGRRPLELVSGDLTEIESYRTVKTSLRRKRRFDGLYCVSDTMALGAYHAIKQKHAVPADVAVVGVGDIESSNFFDPPLSTVGVSHSRLHDEASNLLIDLLQHQLSKLTQLVLDPVVKLRESTGHESMQTL